jgi:hypothetical protein
MLHLSLSRKQKKNSLAGPRARLKKIGTKLKKIIAILFCFVLYCIVF